MGFQIKHAHPNGLRDYFDLIQPHSVDDDIVVIRITHEFTH